MSLKDWLPILIAALSLLVSFFTLYLQRREKKEILKITGGYGFLVMGHSVPQDQIFLEAANTGDRTVTLSSFAMRLPDKRQLTQPLGNHNVRLPHELLPGKSCTMYLSTQTVLQSLVQEGYRGTISLVPVFSAQSGQKFSGKALQFDIDAWLQKAAQADQAV